MKDQNIQITTEQMLQRIGLFQLQEEVLRAGLQQQAQQIDALTKELDAIKSQAPSEAPPAFPQLVEKAQ